MSDSQSPRTRMTHGYRHWIAPVGTRTCPPACASPAGHADSYFVDSLEAAGIAKAAEVCRRNLDLKLGLADASVVVLASRWSTRDLATFDERHFRAVTGLDGESFRLLPADA